MLTFIKVKAELVDATGAVLQTVVDNVAPGTSKVGQLNPTTMRVVVTFSDVASAVASTPPPTRTIDYRFTMTGKTAAGDEGVSDPKDSAACFAPRRMPDGFARFGPDAGPRDPGGDDWAAPSTYAWLDAHRGLVERINDISGEHARDIGHKQHARGTDVDMFHIHTFPGGAASGESNYQRLQVNVQLALNGDVPARTQGLLWAVKTRARFDALIAEVQVRKIRYAVGSPWPETPGMPELGDGWAENLLKVGRYKTPPRPCSDLPCGAWGNAATPTQICATTQYTSTSIYDRTVLRSDVAVTRSR